MNGERLSATVVADVAEPTLQDQAQEPMVYDPRHPQRATTLDHLPGGPAIENGQLVARGSVAALVFTLVAPIASVVGLIVLYARALYLYT